MYCALPTVYRSRKINLQARGPDISSRNQNACCLIWNRVILSVDFSIQATPEWECNDSSSCTQWCSIQVFFFLRRLLHLQTPTQWGFLLQQQACVKFPTRLDWVRPELFLRFSSTTAEGNKMFFLIKLEIHRQVYTENWIKPIELSSYDGEIFGTGAGVWSPRYCCNWTDTTPTALHQRHLGAQTTQQ